ncbi:hypothetical protein [Georgenia sp. EYE_87]|uniref:hypothetical protein n=1 Tax=Georgenia sp. EYE_87 TaxID=2853448 RepID=UPI00200532D5|nr:hypothetical protein [Georgenia sp. EYE_87]
MGGMPKRPRVLILSFSELVRDARLLRQISAVSQVAEVTTMGYGPRPSGATEHLEIPTSAMSLPQTPSGVLKLATRRLRSAELAAPASRAALRLGQGRRWDAVVANDARSLPAAFRLAGDAPVWADMHEWAPEERTQLTSWRLLVAPLMDHCCRVYLPRCAATTTVAGSIADLYADRYGVRPRVMRNAAAWADLRPTPVDDDRIRLVHSGGAVPGRSIELMLDAAVRLGDDFSLDLYLVPAADGGRYLRSLEERAHGAPHIRFHPPVAPDALATTLNAYDVGVFWIPPYNPNAARTLPNKLFDFVQARLAVAIGPTPEMARVVRDHRLGIVSDDFELDTIVDSLRGLGREEIARYKQASHQASRELSFEREAALAREIITTITA